MTLDLQQRIDYLVDRLRSAYGSIGLSSGRPYIYFIYPPSLESRVNHEIRFHLSTDTQLDTMASVVY